VSLPAIAGVVIGGAVFGFTGFAFALFAIAALALEHPPAIAVPAVMLVTDTMTVALLWEHRAAVTAKVLRASPPFAGWSAAFVLTGVAIGTALLARVAAGTGRLALGLVLLLFVALQAWRLRAERRTAYPVATAALPAADVLAPAAPVPLALASLAGGVLDGWLGTGGVAIAAYLTWRHFPPSAFVIALRGYFLATDAVRAVAYGLAGYWTRDTLGLYLVTLLIAVPALLLGVVLRRRLATPARFRAIVLAVLTVYAVAVLVRALGGP
jgi:uncharacterized membrane protein YfcA